MPALRRLAPLAALAAALVAPATAPAAVDIGPERIVVTGDGASATITRAPFRLSVADASGRTVLSQVENTGQAPLVSAPLPQPVPGGSQAVRRPTLYAPLTFTVGAGRSVEFPASQYEGNLLSGVEAGTQFSARDVVEATPEGDGVRLVVSTSDPSGRRLVVTVRPDRRGALRVSARPTPDDGVAVMGDSFAAAPDEPFRGFGGRHNAIDQRGQDFYNWLAQQNTGSGQLSPLTDPNPTTGGDRYLFPTGPQAAYYVQSLFYTRGYGFMLDRPELSRWRMASDRPDAWQVTATAGGLDYVVAPGAPTGSIEALTAINGRHRPPPAWALEPQLDRLVQFPDRGAEVYRQAVRDDLRDIERFDLPLRSYRIEGFEFLPEDELRATIAELRRRGIKPLLYFRLFVGRDNIGTDRPSFYDEAVEKGYVATTPTGQPYVFVGNFNERTAVIDYTDPEAVAWWKGRITRALELGAEGFMQDFGEQVQTDMRFHDGRTGKELHNELPTLAHRATREAIDAFERANPGREIFFYTRAGHSGSPGAAAFESANFPGDESTDWSRSSGIASLTTNMLNRAVGGATGFGTDIGGYFDLGPYTPTTKELFLRWAEWAVLSPVFRLHGSVGAGTHSPWSYDAETVRIYNDLSRLRLRFAPLIGRLWAESARTGVPITRPLWLAFPGDARAATEDQQWMLGEDILVAPVVQQGATSRDVYFPQGCWEHGTTGERFTGARTARVASRLGELPFFFRCGQQPVAAPGAAGLPSARRCVSRRSFTIRLRRPDGARLRSARVTVDGRRVRVVRRGGRLTARVNLRGRTGGRYVVRATVVTRDGARATETRRYRTCVPRRGR